MDIVYYGVTTGEDGWGVGEVLECSTYRRKNETWYVDVPINKDKPELGVQEVECFHVFRIVLTRVVYIEEV